MKLKVGDVFFAKNVCKMGDGSGEALIIGKAYSIKSVSKTEITIATENHENHLFDIYDNEPYWYGKYFDIKQINEPDKDKCICAKCGCDNFNSYVTNIIDDARLYCSDCKTEWGF